MVNTKLNDYQKEILGIFQNSSKDDIFKDLVSYYENTLNAVNFNELWDIYSNDNKVKLKYKFNKPFFSVVVDQLRKNVKLNYLVVNYGDLFSIYCKKELIENNKNSLLANKLQKYDRYIEKELLYTYRNEELYLVKEIIKEKNKSPKIMLTKPTIERFRDSEIFNQYTQYIKDLIAFDLGEIEKSDIRNISSQFILDVKEYWNRIPKTNKNVQVKTMNSSYKFLHDLEKYALNIDVVNKSEYLRLTQYKTTIEELEFVYKFRMGEILEDIEKLRVTEDKKHLVKSAELYNREKYRKYREITRRPIFLIDVLNLHNFYEGKKRHVIDGKKQLYKYCIETSNITQFKHLNKIELDIGRNKLGNIYFKLKPTSKVIKKVLVKIPKRKHIILYVNNTTNIIELLNLEKPSNPPRKSEIFKNGAYNLVLNPVKKFNLKTFYEERINDESISYVNLIDEYNNLEKYHNRFMEFGRFNPRINRLSIRRQYTKRGSLRNIQDPPADIYIERFLINKLFSNDKKRIYPNSEDRYRIIPLNYDTNILREMERQFKSFITFFHSFIQDIEVTLKGLVAFKRLNYGEISEYLENNPFVVEYLKQIFHNCYFNVNARLTSSLNPLSLTKRERAINKAIANLTNGNNPKPKSKKHREVYRRLNIRDYIRDNVKTNKFLIDKWFLQMVTNNLFNPIPDHIPNWCYKTKKHYFRKILGLYHSKTIEYKTAFNLKLITKRDLNYLTNSLKYCIYYNKIVLLD